MVSKIFIYAHLTKKIVNVFSLLPSILDAIFSM